MGIELRPLTDQDHELIELARRTVDENTDGPDGVYTMGAAVRAVDGRMFAGINLYHFTGGPCAELVALGRARAEGARELTTIVAVGNEGRGVQGPCGRDRQIFLDYHPQLRVILQTARGLGSVVATDLLPEGFPWTPSGADVV